MLSVSISFCFFFFFQAEDGIRDTSVTGVQTCALPICETGALEDHREARPDLHPPDDLVLRRVHRHRRTDLLDGLLDGRRSLAQPFGQSGRIGRSIMRAVRIAFSVGRPSRLKKPPGILPAAYIRSSTSTVSGKKSAPSRASVLPWAVARTIVSPSRTTTAPSACFASLPVSNVISRPATSTVSVVGPCVAMLICPPLLFGRWRFESTSPGSPEGHPRSRRLFAQTSTLADVVRYLRSPSS